MINSSTRPMIVYIFFMRHEKCKGRANLTKQHAKLVFVGFNVIVSEIM